MGSDGAGQLAGESWGPGFRVSPRFVIEDAAAEVLGRYRSDGAVSAAQKVCDGRPSVLFCDMAVTAPVMRHVFEAAGAHIWARGGEVVQTDGEVLVVHSGRKGRATVHLPEGIDAARVGDGARGRQRGDMSVELDEGETAWFTLDGSNGRTATE